MDNSFLNSVGIYLIGPAVFALIIAALAKLVLKETKFSTIYLYTFSVIFVFNLIRDLFFPSLIKY